MALDVLNQEKINRLAAEVGQENVPVLLEIFLGELDAYISNLVSNPTGSTSEYLKDISHALKSSAASFGAEALCAIAITIDAKAKAGQSIDEKLDTDEMLDLLQQTYHRYRELLSQ
ncbi:quorum-sensing phosphorelay protein LuxU [Vibrio marisflavi]|uniref:Phosphorelay protein LuxU n=1 Tax=Vibrio marisflavi CECT 7928 TaxID=634439 RepID=A0ABM9A4L2_9VIBR|nr:quorum-sensing phosphorelay protein LuxU [Vibrio marisflavi]CAH0539166.1 Phosphorelay protein LuxU [Vibrio marisflavi CECT 7928]